MFAGAQVADGSGQRGAGVPDDGVAEALGFDVQRAVGLAQDQRVPFTNYASLCAAGAVQGLIQREIEAVNAKLARVETIRKFRLIDVLLTPEDEELTPTMKLKRKVVAKKYEALIEGMHL